MSEEQVAQVKELMRGPLKGLTLRQVKRRLLQDLGIKVDEQELLRIYGQLRELETA